MIALSVDATYFALIPIAWQVFDVRKIVHTLSKSSRNQTIDPTGILSSPEATGILDRQFKEPIAQWE